MAHVTLITGGSRSGKSAHALTLAQADPSLIHRYFIATAEALDGEMRERIAHHQASRPSSFITIEAPLDLCTALASLRGRADIVVVDCLTLWVSNLLGRDFSDEGVIAEADRLAASLIEPPFMTIVVTGEVGSGIVPENQLARRFRDLLGWTNQRLARAADELILMTAGYPVRLK
ncbi:MAG TPA: bifunctional adenosylcobinamide kinase/adenosylcobinamide-phosphate guanylyltransferase [Candidatus Binataceae bacterium]|nr:bifunctional adenosylcobinamide kinase/adenosylcobinamide-phosphate guanylyltransferase [Candidatus Binataceae bacterium]